MPLLLLLLPMFGCRRDMALEDKEEEEGRRHAPADRAGWPDFPGMNVPHYTAQTAVA